MSGLSTYSGCSSLVSIGNRFLSPQVNVNNRPQSLVDKGGQHLASTDQQSSRFPDSSSSESSSSPFPLATHLGATGAPGHPHPHPVQHHPHPANSSSISPSAIRNPSAAPSSACDSNSSSMANSYAMMQQQQNKQGTLSTSKRPPAQWQAFILCLGEGYYTILYYFEKKIARRQKTVDLFYKY